jgi:hypothetical protein
MGFTCVASRMYVIILAYNQNHMIELYLDTHPNTEALQIKSHLEAPQVLKFSGSIINNEVSYDDPA